MKLNLLSSPWRVELAIVFAPSESLMHLTVYVQAPNVAEASAKAEHLARAAAAQRCPGVKVATVRVSFVKHERSVIAMEGPAFVVQTSAPVAAVIPPSIRQSLARMRATLTAAAVTPQRRYPEDDEIPFVDITDAERNGMVEALDALSAVVAAETSDGRSEVRS